MKKFIFSLAFSSLLAFQFSAVNATCTPAGSAPITDGGFFPAPGTQTCAVNNQPLMGYAIQMLNFGFISNDAQVVSTRIDTVHGLPAGLSWNMTVPGTNAANTLLSDEIGCIEITGTPNASTGNYTLDFSVTVDLILSGAPQTVNGRTSELQTLFNNQFGANADFGYFINVVNSQGECTNSVKELTNVSNLNVFPNPFSEKTIISFNSNESAKYTARLIDIMGKEVYTEELNAVSGTNMIALNRNKISGGVYFFVLTNGKATATKKLVVE
jgi:hypothetical protein